MHEGRSNEREKGEDGRGLGRLATSYQFPDMDIDPSISPFLGSVSSSYVFLDSAVSDSVRHSVYHGH